MRIVILCFNLFIGSSLFSQKTIRLDTIQIANTSYLEIGDPTYITFFALNNEYYIAKSSLYRGLIIDQKNRIISKDPLCIAAESDRLLFQDCRYAIVDDTIFFFGYKYFGIAHLSLHANDPNPVRILAIRKKSKIFRSKKFRIAPMRIFQVMSLRSNQWSLLLPKVWRTANDKELAKSKTYPFSESKIKHYRGKVKIERPKFNGDEIKLHRWIRKSPYLYGDSYMDVNGTELWWTDTSSPFVYKFDLNGNLQDSVRLFSQSISEEDFINLRLRYENGEKFRKVIQEARCHHYIYADTNIVVRFVRLGDQEKSQILIYNRAKKQQFTYDCPAEVSPFSTDGHRVYFLAHVKNGVLEVPFFDIPFD